MCVCVCVCVCVGGGGGGGGVTRYDLTCDLTYIVFYIYDGMH